MADRCEIVVLVGIPGSGKTTLSLARFPDYTVVSLDILHSRNKESFEIQRALAEKEDIIIDNTNTTRKTRQRYIDFAKSFQVPIRAIYLKCPLSLAIERNAKRFGDTYVPEGVVAMYFRKLEVPEISEGFDYVEVIDTSSC